LARKSDIRLRRSNVANAVPGGADLNEGELAINTADGALYFKKSDGTIITGHDNTIMHIDSATSHVGIGNTSPAKNLHITDSSSPTIRFSRDNSFYWDIGHTSSDFQFISESGGTVLHMNYDGNIGIGTSSPSEKLDVRDGTITSRDATNTNYAEIDRFGGLTLKGNGTGAKYITTPNTDALGFKTNNVERARIDSSGNLVVGTTSSGISNSSSVTGIDLKPNSASAIVRSGGTTLYLNRLTDDGEILALRKNGTTVGSIGTGGGDLIVGNGSVGIRFNDSISTLVPRTTSDLGSDGAINIGASSARFKDLHLSGASYIHDVRSTGIQYFTHTTDVRFRTVSGTERLRIDSSGNLLVATTDDVVWNNNANSSADKGHNLRSDGRAGFAYYNATANANATVNINRTGSDGDLIRLFKSGSQVGSIGVQGGRLTIGSDDTHIFFDSGDTPSIRPHSGTASTNGVIDIGESGTRFKDLHLSGTANVGGLTINSAYTFPTADGSANQVLQTDGSGNLSFGAVSGSSGVTVSNNANNRVLTGDGTNANAEANLTFDGSTLSVAGRIKTTDGLFQADEGSQHLRQYAISSSAGTQSFLLGKIKSSNSADGGVTGIVKAAYDYGDTLKNVNIHFTFAQRSGTERGHWWYENTDDDSSTDVVSVKLIDDGSNNYYVWLHVGDYVNCFVETTWRQASTSNITDSGSLSAATITTGTTLFDTANDPTAEMHIGKLYPHDDIYLPDNKKVNYGNSNDLQIYHNATDSVIENITGDLYITNKTDDGDIIFRTDDGSGGFTPYLTLDGGNVQMIASQKLAFNDNVRATFGNSSDLQIYHDGSNSYIHDNGTGNLKVRTSSFNLMNAANNELMINASENGAVTLYHDNAAKLATKSDGVDITGELQSDSLDVDGNADISGNLVLGGNLTVNGTQTTLNTATLSVDDLNITVADGAANAAAANGAGLTVDGANATLTYTSTEDRWNFNKKLYVPDDIRIAAGAPSLILQDTTDDDDHSIRFMDNGGTNRMSITTGGDNLNFETTGSRDFTFMGDTSGSGNVGIGTTSPSHLLELSNTMASSPKHIFYRMTGTNTAGGGAGIKFDSSASNNNTGLYWSGIQGIRTTSNDGSNELRFWTTSTAEAPGGTQGAPSQRMVISETGNVGIGTTSPSSILDVAGSAAVLTITDTRNQTFTVGDTMCSLAFDSDDTSGGSGTASHPRALISLVAETTFGSSTGLSFSTKQDTTTAPTEKMRISTAGNVGIGITNPTGKFHLVDGNNFAQIGDLQGNSTMSLRLADTNGQPVEVQAYGSELRFNTATSSGATPSVKMNILANGNVGIGTSSPTTALEVIGDIKIKQQSGYSNYSLIDASEALLTLETYSVNTSSYSADIIFKPAGTERMRIADDGNVGIGEANPNGKLVVRGANYAANQDGGIIIQAGARDSSHWQSGFKIKSDGSGNARTAIDATTGATAGNFAERISIDSAGKVGIGTISPGKELDVVGTVRAKDSSSNQHQLRADKIIAYGTDAILQAQSAGDDVRLNTEGNVTRLIATAEGNVGIGTTTPSYMLDIGGGDFFVNGTNRDWGGAAGLGTHIGTGDFDIYSGVPGGGVHKLKFTNAGSLGIGTTSPDTKLDITASGVEGLIINQDTTTANTSSRLFFKDNVRANGMLNVNGILEFRTGMVVGSTSGTKRLSVSPTLVKSEVPLRVEEYQIDTTTSSTSATTQVAIHTFAAATFRSARFTIQITNTTDSTYHSTEILAIHDGTTANITEFGEVHTGSSVEATFDADISSSNFRLLATPSSTNSMTFKVVCHSLTV